MTPAELTIVGLIAGVGFCCTLILIAWSLARMASKTDAEDRDRLRQAKWRMGERRYDR